METLSYNNYDVYYRTAGDPHNPCIVFLHPAFGDHTIFNEQFDALAKDYFLIAPDMLGHGLTQPASTSDQLDETVEHVHAILEEYNIENCHLVGVSLGSLVVQGFAAAYPERTASVTVVGGYSIHKNNANLQKAQNKQILSWVFKLLFNMNGFRQHIARQSSYHQVGYERMLAASQAYRRKSLRYMPGMGKLFVTREDPVPYPLLIVYGDHELEIALDHGKSWAPLEPNATLRIIEDAGHCANLEQPGTFNAIYREFLSTLENKS
jgi:3-oxoadipate enol-lactonase